MYRACCPGLLRLLGIVCAVALLVVPSALGQQPLRATVVHIEGVPDTWSRTCWLRINIADPSRAI